MSDTPQRLDEKIALVTGSTHGIGLGIAERFVREGASVVLNDNGEHDGEKIERELDGETMFVEADVRNPDELRNLIKTAIDEYSRIDVLVNNVGEGGYEYLLEATIEDWDYTFESSLRSAWLATKYAIADMPEGSSIINISSLEGSVTVPNFFPYDVMKAGMDGLTKSMAVDLGGLGIRVNAIQPGLILLDDPSEEEQEMDNKWDPIGRHGTPEDVAPLAAYLASDESAFMTGSSLTIDGGRSVVLADGQMMNQRRTRDDYDFFS